MARQDPEPVPPDRLRSDARRNRDAILAAALEVFMEEGLEVQTQVIAQRAGVATGTLFRHFPTKEALIDAVGVIQTTMVIDRLKQARDEPDRGSAFERVMWHLIGQHRQYRAVPRAMSNAVSPEIDRLKAEMYGALAGVVEMAQQAGQVRPDLELADVLLLMTACAHVADATDGAHPSLRRRFMTVVFDGMRAKDGSELPRLPRQPREDNWLSVYRVQHADELGHGG